MPGPGSTPRTPEVAVWLAAGGMPAVDAATDCALPIVSHSIGGEGATPFEQLNPGPSSALEPSIKYSTVPPTSLHDAATPQRLDGHAELGRRRHAL